LFNSYDHYRDLWDLREDGRIVLYKRADHQNPKWTVRLKIPGVEGFVVKSTKTTDDYEARRFAEDLYYKLEGRARRGEPVNAPSFKRVFAEWSETQNVDRHLRSKKYINGNVRRLELWLLQYFGDKPIDDVTENTVGDYAEWRYAQARKPAVATLKNERTALNQMLRFAKRKGYIRTIPEFRIKSAKHTARPDLPEREWLLLARSFDEYLARAQDKRRRRERFYLKQYILILANTGIRIGEARRIQWRDISHTRTLTGDIRLVFTVRGKTGEREVVCNEGVDRIVDELRTYRTNELGLQPPADEFIFAHPNGALIGSFKKGFERALKEAGVLHGSDGKKRVPYSLRHTYATMRISEGVNVFQLAANMGTSVEMIDDFYGRKRVRDPEMAEITKTSGRSC
jgi:integrase